jgi:Mor family transcriptional regulator
MANSKTTGRNREIHNAFEGGRSYKNLGEDYALTPQHIRAIINGEKHRREVSTETFYKIFRGGEKVAEVSRS